MTWVSSSKLDDKIYTSATGGVFGNFKGKNYKHKLATNKDVKVAGRETQKKSFRKILQESKTKELVKHTRYIDSSVNSELEKYKTNRDLTRLFKKARKDEKFFEIAFDAFISNLRADDKLSNVFVNDIKRQGYGAMSDEYDTKYSNKPGVVDWYSATDGLINTTEVHTTSAAIFLNRRDDLMTISIDEIKKSDISNAEKWLRKNGYYEKALIAEKI